MQEKLIRSYWTHRGKNGHKGLVMLDEAMHHWTQHGDWTKLGLFLKLSGASRSKLMKLVKLSFGEANIKAVANAKAPSNLGFELKPAGAFAAWIEEHGIGKAFPPFPLDQQNGYGIVRKGIEDGKSFDSQDFTKAVNEAMGKPEKDKGDKSAIEALEVVYKYINNKVKDNQDLKAELTQVMQDIKKRIEARKAKEIAF